LPNTLVYINDPLEVDVAGGSTTANTERRREVAFSLTFFIAGTKLMVPKPPRR
jgi:hypothetical protein